MVELLFIAGISAAIFAGIVYMAGGRYDPEDDIDDDGT